MVALALPLPSSPMAAMLAPENSVVVMRRQLPADVRGALRTVAEGPVFKNEIDLDTGHPNVELLLEGVTDEAARAFLKQDMTRIVTEFGDVVSRRHVYGRLSVIRDDACRKLHADHVTLRLLCTYAGPGTEWVANRDVVRENLARIDVGLEEANRSVIRRPDAVQHCGVGDLILLKGDAYPGNDGKGAVHRSPPIAARGLSRLVFKLDERKCGC